MLRSLSRQARRAAELDTGCWSRGFASEIGNNKKGEELAKRENLKSRETHPDTPSTRSDIIPQTFAGDYRSSSGLGLGDNIHNHTDKWLDVDEYYTGNTKPPMQYCEEIQPIKVHGQVVASYGSDDPGLGCPVEYITLKGTSREKPAVCKYTGNKYYSDDWMNPH